MDSDLVFWALVLWAFSGRDGSAAPPAPSSSTPPAPSSKPADIGEGWWWWWFPTEQSAQYQAALAKELRRSKRNGTTRRWEVRKTMGGTGLGATVVVFYVFEPFRWELPGLPQRAPAGFETSLHDVAWAIPDPPSALRRMVESVAKQTWQWLREHSPRNPLVP